MHTKSPLVTAIYAPFPSYLFINPKPCLNMV